MSFGQPRALTNSSSRAHLNHINHAVHHCILNCEIMPDSYQSTVPTSKIVVELLSLINAQPQDQYQYPESDTNNNR